MEHGKCRIREIHGHRSIPIASPGYVVHIIVYLARQHDHSFGVGEGEAFEGTVLEGRKELLEGGGKRKYF